MLGYAFTQLDCFFEWSWFHARYKYTVCLLPSTFCLLLWQLSHINFMFMGAELDRIIEEGIKRGLKTDADLARFLGESPQAFFNWKTRGSVPGKKLPRIAKKLGVTVDSLFVDGATSSVSANDRVALPITNVEISAGHGAFPPADEAIVDQMTVARDWLRETVGVTSTADLVIGTVKGNSMVPELSPGDLILIALESRDHVPHDGLWVCRLDGDVIVKLLQKRPGKRVKIISINEQFPPYEIMPSETDFAVLGRVIWAWRGKKYG